MTTGAVQNGETATETKCCVFLGAGDEKYGLSYSSSHDLSCLVVDAEDQIARFVAKTSRMCSRLVVHANVLDLGTEAVVVLLER